MQHEWVIWRFACFEIGKNPLKSDGGDISIRRDK